LFELNFQPHPNEALSIKIEVDTNPPKGATLEIDLVRRLIPLRLQHHDRASLLAGKAARHLQREYAKGRDALRPDVVLTTRNGQSRNLVLFGERVDQTHWQGPSPHPRTARIDLSRWK